MGEREVAPGGLPLAFGLGSEAIARRKLECARAAGSEQLARRVERVVEVGAGGDVGSGDGFDVVDEPGEVVVVRPPDVRDVEPVNTSAITRTFCRSVIENVLVNRKSKALKSCPNFRLGFTSGSVSKLVGVLPLPSELHRTGPVGGVFGAAQSGKEFQSAMEAFNCAPFWICRPKAFRGRMGSRVARSGTSESIGMWEAIAQMGETLSRCQAKWRGGMKYRKSKTRRRDSS